MNRYTSMLFRLALFVLATTPVRGQRPELVLPVSPAVPIQVIAFSPDDRFLATGGDNNAIDIWDASTGYLPTPIPRYRELRSRISSHPLLPVEGPRTPSLSIDTTARLT